MNINELPVLTEKVGIEAAINLTDAIVKADAWIEALEARLAYAKTLIIEYADPYSALDAEVIKAFIEKLNQEGL